MTSLWVTRASLHHAHTAAVVVACDNGVVTFAGVGGELAMYTICKADTNACRLELLHVRKTFGERNEKKFRFYYGTSLAAINNLRSADSVDVVIVADSGNHAVHMIDPLRNRHLGFVSQGREWHPLHVAARGQRGGDHLPACVAVLENEGQGVRGCLRRVLRLYEHHVPGWTPVHVVEFSGDRFCRTPVVRFAMCSLGFSQQDPNLLLVFDQETYRLYWVHIATHRIRRQRQMTAASMSVM